MKRGIVWFTLLGTLLSGALAGEAKRVYRSFNAGLQVVLGGSGLEQFRPTIDARFGFPMKSGLEISPEIQISDRLGDSGEESDYPAGAVIQPGIMLTYHWGPAFVGGGIVYPIFEREHHRGEEPGPRAQVELGLRFPSGFQVTGYGTGREEGFLLGLTFGYAF